MAKALYSIYRPKNFDEVLGQEIIKQILINSIERDSINHAYLFFGVRGTGKTTLSRIFSKALNCKKRNGFNPCNKCESCKAINDSSSMDVIEIDAASNNGVDEVRNLIEKSSFASLGKYKIYIIDEIHMFSKSAFNALLKTLEEPPSNTIFLMLTTELHKIPETILSRSLLLNLENISNTDIEKNLTYILKNEGIAVEKGAVEYISELANGSMRDAISFLQAAVLYSENVTIKNICTIFKILDKNIISEILLEEPTRFIDAIQKHDVDIRNLLPFIINKLNEMIQKQTVPKNGFNYFEFQKEILNIYLDLYDPALMKLFFKTIILNNVSRETLSVPILNIQQTAEQVSMEKLIKETQKPDNTFLTNEFTTSKHITVEETKFEASKLETIEDLVSEHTSSENQTVEHSSEMSPIVDIQSTFEQRENVSRETFQETDITSLLNVKHYLTVLQHNEKQKVDHYNKKLIFLNGFLSNAKFSKFVKILSDTKILAVYNKCLVLAFNDELMYKEYKKFSLNKDFLNFLEELLQERVVIMPVFHENYKQLLELFNKLKSKGQELNVIFDETLVYEKNNNLSINIGKSIFGDKFEDK